jgi:hypothetical protein
VIKNRNSIEVVMAEKRDPRFKRAPARVAARVTIEVSPHPDQRGIRVGWLSRRPTLAAADVVAYPPHLKPVQSDDGGGTSASMGRGALAITVEADSGQPVQLLTAHLKSKLLTFPGGRFSPRDEGERARFGAYALYRRTAEAATLRVWATAAMGEALASRPVVVCSELNDTVQAATAPAAARSPGFGDRHRRVQAARPG